MAMTGDEQVQFRRLYDDNVDAVYRYVENRRREHSDVGDVVAEVFAVAWRRRNDKDAAPSSRAWLIGVARRVVADHRRGDARRSRLVTKLSQRPVPPLPDDSSPTTLHDRLAAAIAKLAPRDQELLRLLAWDELSRAEAAAVLGCSINAVNVRLHRALKRLSRALDESPPVSPTGTHDPGDAPDGAPPKGIPDEGLGPSWTSTH
ncbi:MAG: RNA polymerase sigma factor [Acidimicrobiales bacterium]|jgi:RNA polymerase sigma-70 factor (ECF subfamily)